MPRSIRLLLILLAGALAFSASAQDAKKKKGSTKAPAGALKGEVVGGLPPDAKILQLGDNAPDFKLLGIDGRMHTLADYSSAKLLMVIFLSNHCPYSHASETRLIPLANEFKAQGLEVVAINPTAPRASPSPSSATANTTTATRR